MNSFILKGNICYSTSKIELKTVSGYVVCLDGKCTADYVIAHNDNIELYEDLKDMTVFSMITLDTNKEVYDILNNSIKEMKADGTLESLIENELKAYIESDPLSIDIPSVDNSLFILAKTYFRKQIA